MTRSIPGEAEPVPPPSPLAEQVRPGRNRQRELGAVFRLFDTDGRGCLCRERIGVVWIDAHADLHSPSTTASGNRHGMPLAISGGPAIRLRDVDSIDGALCKGTETPMQGWILPEEAQHLHRTVLRDPRVCCWEICGINPHLDALNPIGDISLGVYTAVLEELQQRFLCRPGSEPLR